MIYKTTNYTFEYFTICSKEDENLPIIKDVVNWLQLRYNIKIYIVCSDGEIDYIKTKKWLNSKGINFERCTPNIHE